MKIPRTAEDVYEADAVIETDPGLRAEAEAIAAQVMARLATATLSADPIHTGLLVALQMDIETAAVLAVPGGEPPEALHVTLCYCPVPGGVTPDLVQAAIQAMTAVVAAQGPLEGRVSGIGRFGASESSDAMDVVYASIDIPDLSAFRERVATALSAAGLPPSEAHGYTPHCSLAYLEPGSPSPIQGIPEVALRFRDLTVTAMDHAYLVTFGGGDA